MKRNLNDSFVTSWSCGCRPDTQSLSILERRCPHCGNPMPQTVREQIYLQVKSALQEDIQRDKAVRRRKRGVIVRRWMPIWILGLIILCLIGLRTVMPDLFHPIEEGVGDVLQGAAGLPTVIMNALGGFWQWLCGAFGFLSPVFGWLWSLLEGLWSVLCFLWDLLVELFVSLPELLGWLWEVLGFLLNQAWLLIMFLLEAIPAFFALALGLINLLLQVIVSLLGFLWETITGIFSLFF